MYCFKTQDWDCGSGFFVCMDFMENHERGTLEFFSEILVICGTCHRNIASQSFSHLVNNPRSNKNIMFDFFAVCVFCLLSSLHEGASDGKHEVRCHETHDDECDDTLAQ